MGRKAARIQRDQPCWDRSEEQWRIPELAALIRSHSPDVVFNARMLSEGDYATPEQGAPIEPPDGPWELCLTINDSWGYQHHDHNHKSLSQLIRYFTETIGGGGNLLLDVGPREDGTIPEPQAERLEGLGEWIRRHSEAVYGTVRGLPAGHHYGPSTLSADRRTVYLTLYDIPRAEIGVRAWSRRSAGSPSSAPAPNSPTGSSAGSTRPSVCCGSTHPPRRTSTRTPRCSRSNWTGSWSCTGDRAVSEPAHGHTGNVGPGELTHDSGPGMPPVTGRSAL